MTAGNKTDAQRRIDQIRFFRKEVDILTDEEILQLDPSQRSAIDRYHADLVSRLRAMFDIDADRQEKELSMGMQIASFFGALALSASIFFLFYQFWGRFSTPVQVGVLCMAPIFTLFITMMIAKREPTGYFSKIAGLISVACFVLNLVMLGQIFNITPSDKACLVWAVFAVLLAYATDARLLLAAGIISFACFLSARMGTWSGCYFIHFGYRPENFFPVSILLFLVPWFIPHKHYRGFDMIYRVFAILFFLIPVLILSNWASVSYLSFSNSVMEGFYQIVGFSVSVLLIWIGIRKNWSDVTHTGNVFFVIFLYTKFFDWWWDWLPKYIFFFLIGLTAILFLTIFKRLKKGHAQPNEVMI